MGKAMSITLVLLLALSVSALARPTGETGVLDKVHFEDPVQQASSSPSGVFSTAQQGTTFFGGTVWAADSMRWEAIPGGTWTFETGVGSFIIQDAGGGVPASYPFVNPYKLIGLHGGLEGWYGYDASYSEITYFRRLSDLDPDWGSNTPCVGASAGLGGNFSFWAGVLAPEADELCYAAGIGYGNSWNICLIQCFTFTGGAVTLTYDYVNNTEPGWDYTYVYVDTTGDGDLTDVVTYTGDSGGAQSANFSLTPGINVPTENLPATICIKFCFIADGAYSDQDGLYPTDCGAFAIDNIVVSGGGINSSTDFESDAGGWFLEPAQAGPGGEWANLVHLNDLPAPLTPCECAISDTVLVFEDLGEGGHGEFQDNLASSPWIDLLAAGATAPGKFIEFQGYWELPLLNFIFVQTNIQWYPEICLETDKVIMSEFTSDGFVRYFGGVPSCSSPVALPTRIDFGSVAAPAAEQVRIALGVISYCRFYPGACTGVTNSTPWFDNARLGVFGNPNAPLIGYSTVDIPLDGFPENGSLQIDAPGRIDSNNVLPTWPPAPGSSLGDTMYVEGGLGGAEVRVQFMVDPGPGINTTALNDWLSGMQLENVVGGYQWYSARMDTAERGGNQPTVAWMTAYHEDDPNFQGTDEDRDPNDIDPDGGTNRLLNDIFPDDLFTPGTRINMFYKTQFLPATGVWFTKPDTNGLYLYGPVDSPETETLAGGAYLEWECLPSSMDDADTSWNCVLYVDHFTGRGAQPFIEGPLTTYLGTGSANFEGNNWDRWDVEAPSSQQASFGRPLGSEFGATVNQILGYKAIIWNSGNLGAFCVAKEDGDILLPWLDLVNVDFNNLWLSGNDIAASMTLESGVAQSSFKLLEDYAGVLWQCNTFRDLDCPTGTPADLAVCLDVTDSGSPGPSDGLTRTVVHQAQGNGCPTQRSFDVLALNPDPDFGVALGDEEYTGDAKNVEYASVANDAAALGALSYKTVVDGMSVHYRRDPTDCAFNFGSSPTAVDERIREVVSWFGYTGGGDPCTDPTAGVSVPGPTREPTFRTTLSNFAPNPLMGGLTGRVNFTMARESKANVNIYDVNGRLVKTLFDGMAREGVNELVWDGNDHTGRTVSSGVYFIRLSTFDVNQQTKMVYIANGGR